MTLVRADVLLKRAAEKKIACGAFNVSNMEMIIGAVRAAEEMNTPFIMQVAEGRLAHSPIEILGPMMVAAAKASKVDIAVQLDHGKSFDTIEKALEIGFTSIMFDGSHFPYEENVEKTNAVIKMAEKYGACVEGELGAVGGNEGQGDVEIEYTDPDQAVEFCKRTGVYGLAVGIGNAHGHYTVEPVIRFDILEKIHEKLEKDIDTPLVLHGGSGLGDAGFQKAITKGVRKINIATANFDALTNTATEYLKTEGTHNYFALNEAMVEGVCSNIKHHMKVFNMCEL